MSRDIKDSIVIERCQITNFSTIYLDNIPMYEGSVKTDLDKVRLEPSIFGFQKEPIVKGLSDKYESLTIIDHECTMEVNGISVSITKNQLKLLKALAMEQINRNQDYSDVVAYVFVQLALTIARRKYNYEFEPYENATPMQIEVQKAMQCFINKKLCDK